MGSREKRRRRTIRRAIRHPDVFQASLQHHSRRVLLRPIRTVLTIIVGYVVLVAFVLLASDPMAVQALLDTGVTVEGILPLLPPPFVLVALALATIVSVPVSSIATGVRRDLRSSRSRERRMNDR